MSATFLGYILSTDRIMVDPMKTEAIHYWVRPTSSNKLCSSIGWKSITDGSLRDLVLL